MVILRFGYTEVYPPVTKTKVAAKWRNVLRFSGETDIE